MTGADVREVVSGLTTPDLLQEIEYSFRAAGISWERIAFQARACVDQVVDLGDEAPREALVAGAFIQGYLQGFGNGLVGGAS